MGQVQRMPGPPKYLSRPRNDTAIGFPALSLHLSHAFPMPYLIRSYISMGYRKVQSAFPGEEPP